MKNSILFSFPEDRTMGEALAKRLDIEIGSLDLRYFPDGETYVRIDSDVKGKQVLLVCSLDRPDPKLLPLIFLSKTAKQLGAEKILLVSPYLAYMRQDKRFHEGEAVTSEIFAALISEFADWMVTIDPHLHRRSNLSEIYTIPTSVIHAAASISTWIKENIEKPLLIGPDRESEQWVSEVAAPAEAPFIVLDKIRRGDRDVEVSVPDVKNYIDYTPVLVDDIISTAKTMIAAVLRLKAAGMKPPVCIGVHAVFAENSYQELVQSGVDRVVTCNTIPHPSNTIDISTQLIEQILKQ